MPKMPTYTVDHFLAKFEAIPDEKWCTKSFHHLGQSCVEGLCFIAYGGLNGEHPALVRLLEPLTGGPYPRMINDGLHADYQQSTPKARILAALRDIKAKQEAK